MEKEEKNQGRVLTVVSPVGSDKEGYVDTTSDLEKAVASSVCTYKAFGESFIVQKLYHCYECNFTPKNNNCICESCAKICHKGHSGVVESGNDFSEAGFCDCGAERPECKCMNTTFEPSKRETPSTNPENFSGEGIYYFKNGDMYTGDFKEGKMQGRGKLTYRQGSFRYYEGDFNENELMGYGKFQYRGGNVMENILIEGEIKNGEASGEGKEYYKGRISYKGGFLCGRYEGYGISYYNDDDETEEDYDEEKQVINYEGEWKKGSKNGQGKTFTKKGELIYDGNWEEDKFQGRGKYFDIETGEVLYDGDWEKNEMKGKGTLYYFHEKNSKEGKRYYYEGEFVNDKPHGIGKYCNHHGVIIHHGSFAKGERNGWGENISHRSFIRKELKKKTKKRTRRYVGFWKDDKEHGKGKLYWNNVLRYDGDFKKGKKDGEGKMFISANSYYIGSFKNGVKEGMGKLYRKGVKIYEGGFHNGKFHGRGTKWEKGEGVKGGAWFTGEFKNGWRNTGKLYYPDGRLHIEGGPWKKGGLDGEGLKYYSNGEKYEGSFVRGKRHGRGKLFLASGEILYDGCWEVNRKHGEGECRMKNGSKYTGSFVKGKRDGYGVFVFPDGVITQKGDWKNDLQHGLITETEVLNTRTTKRKVFYNGEIVVSKNTKGKNKKKKSKKKKEEEDISSFSFEYATLEQKNDRRFVLSLMKRAGMVFGKELQYISEDFRGDLEIVKFAVKYSPSSIIYADEKLRTNVNSIIQLLQENGECIFHLIFGHPDVNISSHLGQQSFILENSEILKAALGQNGMLLEHLNTFVFQHHEEWKSLVLTAVKQNGLALGFCEFELMTTNENDTEFFLSNIVMEAIRNNPLSIRYYQPKNYIFKNANRIVHNIILETFSQVQDRILSKMKKKNDNDDDNDDDDDKSIKNLEDQIVEYLDDFFECLMVSQFAWREWVDEKTEEKLLNGMTIKELEKIKNEKKKHLYSSNEFLSNAYSLLHMDTLFQQQQQESEEEENEGEDMEEEEEEDMEELDPFRSPEVIDQFESMEMFTEDIQTPTPSLSKGGFILSTGKKKSSSHTKSFISEKKLNSLIKKKISNVFKIHHFPSSNNNKSKNKKKNKKKIHNINNNKLLFIGCVFDDESFMKKNVKMVNLPKEIKEKDYEQFLISKSRKNRYSVSSSATGKYSYSLKKSMRQQMKSLYYFSSFRLLRSSFDKKKKEEEEEEGEEDEDEEIESSKRKKKEEVLLGSTESGTSSLSPEMNIHGFGSILGIKKTSKMGKTRKLLGRIRKKRRNKYHQTFSGSFKYGLKHGNGNEFDINNMPKIKQKKKGDNNKNHHHNNNHHLSHLSSMNSKRFEGEYWEGMKHGKGIEYKIHEKDPYTAFEGMFFQNKRHGRGESYDPISGRVDRGFWVNNSLDPTTVTTFTCPILNYDTIVKDTLSSSSSESDSSLLLGEGAYGSVYKVRSENYPQLIEKYGIEEEFVAVKIMKCNTKFEKLVIFKMTKRGVGLCHTLNSENIIKVYGIVRGKREVGYIMELCSNDISKIIKASNQTVDIEEKKRILLGTAKGMKVLHESLVMHRDLKWPNVMISFDNKVKITDFDTLKEDERIWRLQSMIQSSRIGTPGFLAPEVFLGKEYTLACDVYAFGLMIYSLLWEELIPQRTQYRCSCGQIVSQIIQSKLIDYHVANCDLRPLLIESEMEKFPRFLIDLMLSCWDGDPMKRPSFEEIVHMFESEAKKEKCYAVVLLQFPLYREKHNWIGDHMMLLIQPRLSKITEFVEEKYHGSKVVKLTNTKTGEVLDKDQQILDMVHDEYGKHVISVELDKVMVSSSSSNNNNDEKNNKVEVAKEQSSCSNCKEMEMKFSKSKQEGDELKKMNEMLKKEIEKLKKENKTLKKEKDN